MVSRRRGGRCSLSPLLACLLLIWPTLAASGPDDLAAYYLADDADRFDAEAAGAGDAAAGWRPLADGGAHFGFSRSPYWLRIRLPARLPEDPLLVIDNPHLDRIDFYQVADGTLLQHRSAGDLRPFGERPWPDKGFVFPLQRAAAASEVALRVESGGLLRVPVRLWDAAEFRREQLETTVRWAAALGALAGLVVLHGVAYVGSRQRVHLGFTALITVLAMFYLCLEGFAYQLLWPNAPAWQNQAMSVLTALAAAALSGFALALLRLPRRPAPRVSVLGSLWLLLCTAAVVASALLPYWLSLRVVVLFGLTAIAVAAVAGLLLWLRGDRPLRAIAAAWLLLCAVTLLSAAAELGLPGGARLSLGLQPLPVAAAIGLLSLSLVFRQLQMQFRLIVRQAEAIRRLRAWRQQRLSAASARQALQDRLRAPERELERLRAAPKAADSAEVGSVKSRHIFDERYRIEWRRAYRERSLLSLALFEIDGFDSLTSTHGATVGEQCLRRLATVVQERFRRPSDLVTRFAVGSIVVLAPGTAQAEMLRLAESVRRCMGAEAAGIPALPRYPPVSVGIAGMVPDERHHDAVLLSLVDDALYQARLAGGNRAVCYRLPRPAAQREEG